MVALVVLTTEPVRPSAAAGGVVGTGVVVCACVVVVWPWSFVVRTSQLYWMLGAVPVCPVRIQVATVSSSAAVAPGVVTVYASTASTLGKRMGTSWSLNTGSPCFVPAGTPGLSTGVVVALPAAST